MLTVDGMVDAATHARFAALGMRVVATPDPNLPVIRNGSQADAHLVADLGTVGFFYTGGREHGPHRGLVTANLWRDQDLMDEYNKAFGNLSRPVTDTVEDFLFVFERFGDLVERWRLPRRCLGSAYALACHITLPPFNRPRKMRHVVKTMRQLDASDVEATSFYEMLARLSGAKVLERATAAVVFQQQHGLNWALVQEMFA